MIEKNAFSIFLLFLIISVLTYWYLTRPTLQERTVTDFFDNIRRGNVQEASDYLINSNYGEFLINSKITDSDGNDLMSAIEKDPAYLDELAWTYIPAAKGHVFRFDAESLKTEKLSENVSLVTFKYRFSLKEYFDEPSRPGTIEGTMELQQVDKKWLIKKGDFKIFIKGITLRSYWSDK